MEKGSGLIKSVINIKDFLRMIRKMVREHTNGPMGMFTAESFSMT